MIKVSVIIPVFNTRKYVEEAVQSILNQTLKEIEVIIIDDGSTDNSAEILEYMALLDSRIILFRQENKGPSVSRNRGIEQAIGEYIYFMDSDDILETEALALCYQKCKKEELDFVFFDAEIFGKDLLSFDYKRTDQLKEGVYTGRALLEFMLTKKIYRSSVCLNLIKRAYIQSHTLQFLPDIIHEDELYSFSLYIHAQRVSFISRAFYKRRVREESIMTRQFSLRNTTSYFIVLQHIIKKRDEENKDMIDQLIRYIINPVIYNSASLRLTERLKITQTCIKQGFLPYIRSKNLLVLVFPWLINLKGYLKKWRK